MRFLVRAAAEVPDDKWPFIEEHGAELLREEVVVVRDGVVPRSSDRWIRIEMPHVQEPWATGVRYVAAIVFETLVGGTAFAIGDTGKPRAWPQAERDEELRQWVLTPPPQSTTFLIPDEYEEAELRVRVERELAKEDIDGLRRMLRSKCERPDGGIREWWARDGSTTILINYNFRYWEPGMCTTGYGFDHWWLAAECMEAWTGGTVTWWCGFDYGVSFDKARRDAMLRCWPMQHVENMQNNCRAGGRVNIFIFGEGQSGLADIVAAKEDGVLVRYLSRRAEQWLPYYRLSSCFNV